ncbi:D-alanyl-D-alanine carboxypeptidase [Candidatus Uhrbacteria bacterium]|nr:D-alanyl-D-alanine carboxypeptidase [Candidatus Uhrbacteria bacterium]
MFSRAPTYHPFLMVFLFLCLFIPTTAFANTLVVPERIDPSEIESKIGAKAYIVMDRATGEFLTIKQENRVWPIASLTKLVTASIVLEQEVSKNQQVAMRNTDNVGGARLWVNDGDTLSVDDLFYATLVASANNAAIALSRSSGFSKDEFIQKMNDYAKSLNLSHTKFVDQSGIDPGNQSTPLEMARIAQLVLQKKEIQHYTTTAQRFIKVANKGTTKKMTSTNWMLYKPQYDDVFVTGGKTGYLEESGWNLVVTLEPKKNDERELLIVLFGASSRAQSFADAKKLALWSWNVYEWKSNSPTSQVSLLSQ